jgi:hypothetical protein
MLALLVVLVMSVSFAVPAEDAPETSYDESESLPFDGTPVLSLAAARIFERLPHRTRRLKVVRICSGRAESGRFDIRAGLPHPICHSPLTTLHQSFRC